MISHKHKFIFIHIPKTAGTSIEQALRDETCKLLPGQWDHARVRHAPLNHLTLQELVDYGALTPAQLKSYFKFCFVRNPWERLVSEIFCPWMSPWFKDLPLEERIRRACELAATPTGIANHLRPQADFVQAGGLQMDFIGRFERLEEDFAQICRLLGIEAALSHLNRSGHRPYQDYYDAETQALVATAYRGDIDAFHYTFGGAMGDRAEDREATQRAGTNMQVFSGKTTLKAYPLVDRPAPLQLAPATAMPADQQGWQIICPTAFEATWNGGPNAADIEIRLIGDATAQPAFVQSNHGGGVLTFYPGYQFTSDDLHILWLRGPINAPKDALYALEQIVDTSLLPCTVAVHWQFTRAHQTICFEAGEPFATLLLYPKAGLGHTKMTVVHRDDDEETYAQVVQELIDAPALHRLFQDLGATIAPAALGPKLPGR